jgi:hypothetical protein
MYKGELELVHSVSAHGRAGVFCEDIRNAGQRISSEISPEILIRGMVIRQ